MEDSWISKHEYKMSVSSVFSSIFFSCFMYKIIVIKVSTIIWYSSSFWIIEDTCLSSSKSIAWSDNFSRKSILVAFCCTLKDTIGSFSAIVRRTIKFMIERSTFERRYGVFFKWFIRTDNHKNSKNTFIITYVFFKNTVITTYVFLILRSRNNHSTDLSL